MGNNDNIIEFIDITNSGQGTLDAARDMIILSEHSSSVPVVRPPYIAENIANKKNDLVNPNTTGYTSTLAVYNAMSSVVSKSIFNAFTGDTSTNLNIINNNIVYISGNTLSINDFNVFTGTTLPNNYVDNVKFNQYTGSTALEREIMFYADQEVIIQHIDSESVNTVYLSNNITDVEYSLNAGSSWLDPTYPIPFSGGTESVWRVKTYLGTDEFGNVIIKSII